MKTREMEHPSPRVVQPQDAGGIPDFPRRVGSDRAPNASAAGNLTRTSLDRHIWALLVSVHSRHIIKAVLTFGAGRTDVSASPSRPFPPHGSCRRARGLCNTLEKTGNILGEMCLDLGQLTGGHGFAEHAIDDADSALAAGRVHVETRCDMLQECVQVYGERTGWRVQEPGLEGARELGNQAGRVSLS